MYPCFPKKLVSIIDITYHFTIHYQRGGNFSNESSNIMTSQDQKSGSDFFIVDNSDADWKVLQYLKE